MSGNVQRFNQPILAPDYLRLDGASVGGAGASPLNAATAVGAVTIVDTPLAAQRLRVTITNYVGVITAAADFYSLSLATMGDRYLTLGIRSEMDFVKDGTGVVSGAAIDVSMSSVAASSQSLSTFANSDVMLKKDINGAGNHLDQDFDSFAVISGTTVTSYPRPSAGSGLFLNVQSAVTVDGSITINGWIDIFYIDLGSPA